MSTLKLKRGTTAQNNSYVGPAGEITVDETAGTLRVHNGSTAGGKALSTVDHLHDSRYPLIANTVTLGGNESLYVNSVTGNDNANGTYGEPLKTINGALSKAARVKGWIVTIYLAPGTYDVDSAGINQYVSPLVRIIGPKTAIVNVVGPYGFITTNCYFQLDGVTLKLDQGVTGSNGYGPHGVSAIAGSRVYIKNIHVQGGSAGSKCSAFTSSEGSYLRVFETLSLGGQFTSVFRLAANGAGELGVLGNPAEPSVPALTIEAGTKFDYFLEMGQVTSFTTGIASSIGFPQSGQKYILTEGSQLRGTAGSLALIPGTGTVVTQDAKVYTV